MKKLLFSLVAMACLAFSFVAKAQTPIPCKLKAKFDYKVDKCNVDFTDLSAAGTGTIITNWYWDFGDVTTSILSNPSHTYGTPGTYTVCLTIVGVNVQGVKCKDQFCTKVTVDGCGQTAPCKLKPKFDFNVDKCTVTFMDYSSSGLGTTITNWYWDFGDGNTSTLQNPSHVYTVSGVYDVCLVIVGNNGLTKCKEQICLKVKVDGCGNTLPCGVKPLFKFKADKCTLYFADNSGTNPGTTITSWYWTFGDATTSTLQNPIHTYAASGVYTVCLTTYAMNANGDECKNTYCIPVAVAGCGQIDPCGVKPLFDFKIDKCAVSFVDQSGTNTGTTITSWFWDFGDATTSTLQNPNHTYALAGTYTVCLTTYAVNAAGMECKNTYCKQITVNGCGQTDSCKLAAKFDFKVDTCTVSFADASTTGTGTTITNWYWSFGDAAMSTLQNPSHTYAVAGTYTVCLTILGTNPAGQLCKDQFCKQVTVDGCGQIDPCKLGAKFDFKVDTCTVSFADASTTGTGTTITNWYWSFGDATMSTLQNPSHTYAIAGTYTVCLTIVGTNAMGQQCKDQFCAQVTVDGCGQMEPCKLGAKFDFKVDTCTVFFDDASTTGTGTTITNWYWSFGDTTLSTLQNPSHTYAVAGTYTVCLTILGINAAGQKCKDEFCTQVTVKGCGQTEPCLVAGKFDYEVDGCNMSFTDYSTTAPGTVITYWEWNFGDGSMVSGVQNPSHVYSAPGNYVVCLIIVGTNTVTGERCKDKVCLDVVVKECNPSQCAVYPKFDYKVDLCNVNFVDNSTAGAGTFITNWYWDFGDGTTSILPNPSHTYATAGTYEVCLIVVGRNVFGMECKDRICLKVEVDSCEKGISTGKSAQISSLEVYPNPAQQKVNISFRTNTESLVTVSISDIQGRILAVIQDGQMTAGNHKLNWEVNVNSGLYIITIKTNAAIEQRKLIIEE